MKKIKTFEDACKALKLNPVLPDVSMLPEMHRKSITAFYMLTIIIEALNGKWKPDWSNEDQDKYFNWFGVEANKKNPSGFGFSGTYTYWSGTGAAVGSRLCFKSRELAEYAREQFKDLYKDYLLLPQ